VGSGFFPLINVGSSIFGQRLSIGLAHQVYLPWIGIFALTLLAQSFAAYWVHRLMHATPLLWRVHRVHHADSWVDVSTSLRNHPLELLLTVPTSSLVVLILGAPVSAVAAVDSLFVAAAIWEHTDIPLPPWLDQMLSTVIVTPRLHRLHHARKRRIHDSNYGNLITFWDRLFGTLNTGEGRGSVGLDGQTLRPDHLLEQVCSPLYRI
jgi:sterol desaturase/sphingolipid hydroxylase (fatty acid hydroxylase superfamily)